MRDLRLRLVALIALSACNSAPKKTTPPNGGTPATIEIFSWWIAGGEAQALSNLIDAYKSAYPQNDVLNTTATATAAGAVDAAFQTLKTRLAADDPPDVWQAILGTDLISYTEYVPPLSGGQTAPAPVNKTVDLTSLYASEGWTDKIPPGVLAAMKDGDGIFAVPLSISRINDLYYNQAIFTRYGLQPPTTVAELFAIGDALAGKVDAQGDPIIPMVISAGDSIFAARFVADAVLLAEPQGIQFRQDYYAGTKGARDPLYAQAATDFNTLLTQYSNSGNATFAAPGSPNDALNLTWQGGANLIHSGQAAMFICGDWVKAYLQSLGDVVNQDFGAVEFPPKAFVYAGDSFVLGKGAPHYDAALDFLKLIGDPKVQSAFNKVKGGIPARTDADTSTYDPIGQQTASDFRDPTVAVVPSQWDYAPTAYWGCWSNAVHSILENHDANAFATACTSQYSTLSAGN